MTVFADNEEFVCVFNGMISRALCVYVFAIWTRVRERESEIVFPPFARRCCFFRPLRFLLLCFQLHLCWAGAAWHVVHIWPILSDYSVHSNRQSSIEKCISHLSILRKLLSLLLWFGVFLYIFWMGDLNSRLTLDTLHKCSCDCFISVYLFLSLILSRVEESVCVVMKAAHKTMADCDHYLILTLLLQQYVSRVKCRLFLVVSSTIASVMMQNIFSCFLFILFCHTQSNGCFYKQQNILKNLSK